MKRGRRTVCKVIGIDSRASFHECIVEASSVYEAAARALEEISTSITLLEFRITKLVPAESFTVRPGDLARWLHVQPDDSDNLRALKLRLAERKYQRR